MHEDVLTSHSRNGLLRQFGKEEAATNSSGILFAKISQNGALCATLTDNGLFVFTTLSNGPITKLAAIDVEGLIWSKVLRSCDEDLTALDSNEYLIVLDAGFNICVYSVQHSYSKEPCKGELVSFIGKEIFNSASESADVSEAPNVNQVEILEATHDDCKKEQTILCLINGQEIIVITACIRSEPNIKLRLELGDGPQQYKFVYAKVKDHLLVLVTQNAVIYVVDLKAKKIVFTTLLFDTTVVLKDEFDGNLAESIDSRNLVEKCDISNDLTIILVLDSEENIHIIEINIGETDVLPIQPEGQQTQIDKTWRKNQPQYEIESQNRVWKNELNLFHQELITADFTVKEDYESFHGQFYGDDIEVENLPFEERNERTVKTRDILRLPEWTSGFHVENLLSTKETALITMMSSMSTRTDGDDEDNIHGILLKLDLKSMEFLAQSLPENAAIAVSESNYFPHCILTNELMFIPTFNATQEELISSIIQFSGIADAETICRANQWNQFSIPLHSLEVGLQHRQVDTISFFLRTRDKAFSRYWSNATQRNMTSPQSESTTDSLDVNPNDVISSPSSLKSLMIKSTSDESEIDPTELHKAVNMLIKSIHKNSKGKHKKNFFETLLRLTMDFLSNLIKDGSEVWNNIGKHSLETKSGFKQQNESFTFLIDIPESLTFLVECIVDVRQFVGDIPSFYVRQDERTNILPEAEVLQRLSHSHTTLFEHIEAEISAGRLARLQKYLLKEKEMRKIEDDFDCLFESLVRFGLRCAFRKLTERKMEEAINILKNLGIDETIILRQLFDVTLDRGLRKFLQEEFKKVQHVQVLSHEDLKDVEYMDEIERMYPSNVYNRENTRNKWGELEANFHDRDDLEVTGDFNEKLESLGKRDSKGSASNGLYCELMYQWVHQMDDKSRKMMILDAAYLSQPPEKPNVLADAETFWEYLINHNDEKSILEWLNSSFLLSNQDDTLAGKYPAFDTMLLDICGNATEQVQRSIYRQLARLGVYTEGMRKDFYKILNFMSQEGTIFKKTDESYTFPMIFASQFIAYCVKNNLRDVLYTFLDQHGLYPSKQSLEDEDIDLDQFPWFKMMMSFRHYQKDKSGMQQMSLSSAENILSIHGGDVEAQLCTRNPLIIVATILASSVQLKDIFLSDDPDSTIFKLNENDLKEALKQYRTLYAAIYRDEATNGNEETSTIQLLQDNTEIDAETLFAWRTKEHTEKGLSSLPNFSSPELVEKFGLQINMSYSYYLKQRQPVYAYLVFIRDTTDAPGHRERRMKKAYSRVYKIAIANFDSIPAISTCTLFIDLLGMDSRCMRVDVESANFILKNLKKKDDNRYDTAAKLKCFIVSSLKSQSDGRSHLLQMLEECIEAGLRQEGIEWSSFEAIVYYRIAVQFAQVNDLSPPTRLIEECVKDGCWFHAIVFIQMYQFKPSQVLSSLEKTLKNTVLLDHMYAVIKNTKIIQKGESPKKVGEKRPKNRKQAKQQSAALEKDFRAQFYFNLKKGPENRPVSEEALTSPTKTSEPSAEKGQLEKRMTEPSSDSNDSILDQSSEQSAVKIDTLHSLDDVLGIIIECEETGFPSKALLKYAFDFSQPFLAVLAACYQDSIPIDCLSTWLVSSASEDNRQRICESVHGIESSGWTVVSLFEIISEIIRLVEDAAKIITEGFKIFMKENIMYSFFAFYEAFTLNENWDHCKYQLESFVSKVKVCESDRRQHDYKIRFFEQMIPVKILLKLKSKFYQKKLLEFYINAGLQDFLPQSSTTLKDLSTICELTKETDVIPDYMTLVSFREEDVNREKNRIFEFLIEEGHLEKATLLAKSLVLPVWKVSLSQVKKELRGITDSGLWLNSEARLEFWLKSDATLKKCNCSPAVAGRFFEEQGQLSQGLPYEEKALLLAIAFSWYATDKEQTVIEDGQNGMDNVRNGDQAKEIKLNQLEKQVWLLRIHEEVSKKGKEREKGATEQARKTSRNCNQKISELLNRRQRNGSELGQINNNGRDNLLLTEENGSSEYKEETKWTQMEKEAFDVIIGQLLDNCEVAQAKRVSTLFGRKTKDLEFVLSSIYLAQGTKQVESLDEKMKSILAKTPARSLSMSGTYDPNTSLSRSLSTPGSAASPGFFMEDWVLVEEVQNAIEKLMSKCKKGRKCCERVLVSFKISKMLSLSYEDIVIRDPFEVLQLVIYSDMDQQRQICRQYIRSFDLRDEEVAALVAKIVIRWIQSRSNIGVVGMTTDEYTDTMKFNTHEISRLMQLVQKPSVLGIHLLDEAKSMGISEEQNENDVSVLEAYVELLVRAHDCFTLACNMEGISEVLRIARLCTLQLINAKAYSLMVRVLTGIGRFKEMSYIFEALDEVHHFELLFRKDIEKESQLKSALLDYIKKHHENDTEKMDMLSRRFGMYREVGEQLEETGEKQIRIIKDKFSGSLRDLEGDLKEIARTFTYAAGNYRKVDCLRRSTHCRKLARLAELQIQLIPTAKQIIGLDKLIVTKLLRNHQDFYEALVIADAYNLSSASCWVDPLFDRVIIKGELNYLKQYLSVFQLTGPVMMEIVSRYRSERISGHMSENLRKMLSHLKEVKLRYKIASELNLHDVINDLQDGPNGAFLRDTMFIHH